MGAWAAGDCMYNVASTFTATELTHQSAVTLTCHFGCRRAAGRSEGRVGQHRSVLWRLHILSLAAQQPACCEVFPPFPMTRVSFGSKPPSVEAGSYTAQSGVGIM